MPATIESIASMPPLQRRMAEAWLTRFEENWHNQKLHECMHSLPRQSSMRRPLLLAMIERDLAHQWNSGHSVGIENYLHEFPELGGVDDVPIELIASEFNIRRKKNGVELSEFAERFPTRIDDLYGAIKSSLSSITGPAVKKSAQEVKEAAKPAPAPALPDPADPISVRRLQLLRAVAAPDDPPPPPPVQEPIQATASTSPPAQAELELPPAPSPPTRKIVVAQAETVWDEVQPARASQSGTRLSAPSRPPVEEPPQPIKTSSPPAQAELELPLELPPALPEPARKPEPAQETIWDNVQPVRASESGTRLSAPTASAKPPAPRSTLGRYTIEKRLGSSGQGPIHLAADTQLDRRVVLQIPHFAGAETSSQRAQFRREARAVAALCNPLLCPVLDVVQINDVDFMVMPFVDGETLRDVLKQRTIWPGQQAIDLVLKLAAAMDAAHRHGAVHRNLKPSKILITPGETPVIVGFAQVANPTPSQRSSDLAYLAPELARGGDASSPQADVYSLGVMLYQLLSGKAPPPGGNPSATFPPDLDMRLQIVCLKAMAVNPDERFKSMRDFSAELTICRQGTRTPDADVPVTQSRLKRAAGSAPGKPMPAGLSAVPPIDGALGLTPAPAPPPKEKPVVKPYAPPKPGVPATPPQPARQLPPGAVRVPQSAARRPASAARMNGLKWLAAGAVGGLALMAIYFGIRGGKKQVDSVAQSQSAAPTIDELKNQLYSSGYDGRMAVIDKLKARKEPEALDVLVRFVADGDWLEGDDRVEDRAKALAIIREKAPDSDRMVTALKQANKSKDARIRIWACGAVAVFIDSDLKEQLLPLLLAALRDANPDLRQATAEQIKKNKLNDATIISALANRVADNVWGVAQDPKNPGVFVRHPDKDGGKSAAAEALHELAPKKLEPALQAASRSTNPDIRRWAEETKKKYGLD